MNKEILPKLLDLLSHIPIDIILRDLKSSPGWSYHGPSRKTQEKISPGLYKDPVIHIKREDHDNPKNWHFHRSIPHYEILSFLASDVNTVTNKALKIIRDNNQKIDEIIFDGNKITVSLNDNGEELITSNEDPLLSAYELYVEALYIENAMIVPTLGNIGEVEDIDRLYQDEPTILFLNYPYHLEDKKFKEYFTPLNRTNGCIGKIKLLEGEFWVMSKRHKISSKSYSSAEKEKATNIGGLINRLN